MRHILDEILHSPQFTEGASWNRRFYAAGDKIIEKGESGNTLFFVESGCVRVLGGAELQKDVRIYPGLCDLEVGALFGDICLFGEHRRTASVEALTESTVLEIRSDMLRVYLDDHPVQGYLLLKALFEVMVNRLETANDRIEKLLAWGIKAHDIDKYL